MASSHSKTNKLRRLGDAQSLGTLDTPLSTRWLAIGGLAAAGLAWAWLNRQRHLDGLQLPLSPLVNPMVIRVDAGGDGHYGSLQDGHRNAGVDLVCRAGQSVYAPFSGIVTSESIPYAKEKQWRGLTLESDTTSLICALTFCVPVQGIVGRRVTAGQPIGLCQNSSKGISGVHDYLHVAMSYNGKLVNPEPLLFNPEGRSYKSLPF